MSKWRYYDYQCGNCGETWECMEERGRAPVTYPCDKCDGMAEIVPSCPKIKTCWAWANKTGKSDPPPPGTIQDQILGDHGTRGEYLAAREKQRLERRHRQIKRLLG